MKNTISEQCLDWSVHPGRPSCCFHLCAPPSGRWEAITERSIQRRGQLRCCRTPWTVLRTHGHSPVLCWQTLPGRTAVPDCFKEAERQSVRKRPEVRFQMFDQCITGQRLPAEELAKS